jgi:hypothetical protein
MISGSGCGPAARISSNLRRTDGLLRALTKTGTICTAAEALASSPKRISSSPPDAGQHKTYGAADPTLTYGFTPALISGDSFSGALGRAAGENVGTYAIQQGTLSADANCNLMFVAASLQITARPITVTADGKTKVFGDVEPALTYQITSGSLAFSDALTGALTRLTGENVGTYAIQQGTLALSSNYTLTFVGANLIITPALLTVTADDQTMILHGAVPTLTFKITGFKTGETASVLTTQPTCTTAGTSASGVGSYPITCSSAVAANYTFSYMPGQLTIRYSTRACLGDLGHAVLQPINATGTMSVFKLGSTVPTKFRVCDANGVSIGTPGVVIGYGLVAAVNSLSITVDEDAYSTTPDTAFRWAGDQWIFNQSTKNNGTLNKTNTTYYFGISLNDGSWIYFQYGLK